MSKGGIKLDIKRCKVNRRWRGVLYVGIHVCNAGMLTYPKNT